MARFLRDDLPARLIKGDKIWKLYEPLFYESDFLGTIEIPEGFESDLASVPRVPIVYWFYGGRCHREAFLHDYLYRVDSVPVVTFAQANEAFFEAMQCRNKKVYVRYPMWWGVWIGGYFSYHKKSVGDSL